VFRAKENREVGAGYVYAAQHSTAQHSVTQYGGCGCIAWRAWTLRDMQ